MKSNRFSSKSNLKDRYEKIRNRQRRINLDNKPSSKVKKAIVLKTIKYYDSLIFNNNEILTSVFILAPRERILKIIIVSINEHINMNIFSNGKLVITYKLSDFNINNVEKKVYTIEHINKLEKTKKNNRYVEIIFSNSVQIVQIYKEIEIITNVDNSNSNNNKISSNNEKIIIPIIIKGNKSNIDNKNIDNESDNDKTKPIYPKNSNNKLSIKSKLEILENKKDVNSNTNLKSHISINKSNIKNDNKNVIKHPSTSISNIKTDNTTLIKKEKNIEITISNIKSNISLKKHDLKLTNEEFEVLNHRSSDNESKSLDSLLSNNDKKTLKEEKNILLANNKEINVTKKIENWNNKNQPFKKLKHVLKPSKYHIKNKKLDTKNDNKAESLDVEPIIDNIKTDKFKEETNKIINSEKTNNVDINANLPLNKNNISINTTADTTSKNKTLKRIFNKNKINIDNNKESIMVINSLILKRTKKNISPLTKKNKIIKIKKEDNNNTIKNRLKLSKSDIKNKKFDTKNDNKVKSLDVEPTIDNIKKDKFKDETNKMINSEKTNNDNVDANLPLNKNNISINTIIDTTSKNKTLKRIFNKNKNKTDNNIANNKVEFFDVEPTIDNIKTDKFKEETNKIINSEKTNNIDTNANLPLNKNNISINTTANTTSKNKILKRIFNKNKNKTDNNEESITSIDSLNSKITEKNILPLVKKNKIIKNKKGNINSNTKYISNTLKSDLKLDNTIKILKNKTKKENTKTITNIKETNKVINSEKTNNVNVDANLPLNKNNIQINTTVDTIIKNKTLKRIFNKNKTKKSNLNNNISNTKRYNKNNSENTITSSKINSETRKFKRKKTVFTNVNDNSSLNIKKVSNIKNNKVKIKKIIMKKNKKSNFINNYQLKSYKEDLHREIKKTNQRRILNNKILSTENKIKNKSIVSVITDNNPLKIEYISTNVIDKVSNNKNIINKKDLKSDTVIKNNSNHDMSSYTEEKSKNLTKEKKDLSKDKVTNIINNNNILKYRNTNMKNRENMKKWNKKLITFPKKLIKKGNSKKSDILSISNNNKVIKQQNNKRKVLLIKKINKKTIVRKNIKNIEKNSSIPKEMISKLISKNNNIYIVKFYY